MISHLVSFVAIYIFMFIGLAILGKLIGFISPATLEEALVASLVIWTISILKDRSNKIGKLDFYSKNVRLKTDESKGVVEGYVHGKTFSVPIVDIWFRYTELTTTVTEPKIESGTVDGKLWTGTNGFITYDKKTGKVLVEVIKKSNCIGSFQMNLRASKQLQTVTEKIQALSLQLRKERDAHEAKLQEEKERQEQIAQEQHARKIKESSDAHARKFIEECQLNDGQRFGRYERSSEDGSLLWAVAVDTQGKGGLIYNNGKDTWFGSFKGAQSQISGGDLEILLDDENYRNKFFKEHRVTLPIRTRDVLIEWNDRLNILARV